MTTLDVAHIARLARLDLSDAELADFTPQLERILGMMRELDALPLAGAVPMRPGAPALRARPDETARPIAAAGALRNAPAREGGLFTVPRAAPRKGPRS